MKHTAFDFYFSISIQNCTF